MHAAHVRMRNEGRSIPLFDVAFHMCWVAKPNSSCWLVYQHSSRAFKHLLLINVGKELRDRTSAVGSLVAPCNSILEYGEVCS